MPIALRTALMTACVTLSACTTPIEPVAVIHYKQLGGCTRAQTGSGVINVPPSHAIVIFRVSHIDNTKTGKSWSFDSTTLQVNEPSEQNLGGLGPVAIAAGQDVTVNAPVGILVTTSNADGSDVASVNYFLQYPLVPPAPGTLGAKENANQLHYPFATDCNVIAGT